MLSVDAVAGDGPIVLALHPDPVLAFFHRAGPVRHDRIAVLFCPPFGWEEVCSYPALRTWATDLADAGFPSARLQLPSTGDSGGVPGDPDRLEAWTGAIHEAADWLRETTGADRLTAIGIGLGGLLACRAVASGAAIDDLVLWSVRARGRTLLREMRAFARVIADRYPEESRPELLAPGELDLAGFLMSADTAGALESVELSRLALPQADGRRVLLLERDGLPADPELREHFERAGAAVSVQPTDDYTPMMLDPLESAPPRGTIEATLAWLRDGSPARAASGGVAARARTPPARPACRTMELEWQGSPIRETPLRLQHEDGEMFGVLTEGLDAPPAPFCAMWLGAGALRHIGPNRMWVEIARRWAARGVSTVRVDLPGIGDAGDTTGQPLTNQNLYAPARVEQARTVLDQLVAAGLPDRVLLGGLCVGAYWTLRLALADERVLSAIMVNLYAFTWSEALAAERETSSALRGLRSALWRRVLRLRLDQELVTRSAQRLRPARIRAGLRRPAERAQAEEARRAFEAFDARGLNASFLLSRGEALHGQLSRLGVLSDLERWPGVRVEALPTRDHAFHAVWLQRLVHASADRALDRTLQAIETPVLPG